MFSSHLSPNSPNLFTYLDSFSEKIGNQLNEEMPCFRLPNFQGNIIAYKINNDSMSPTLSIGDIALCSPIESIDEIKENKLYAIVTAEKTWVKRLQCIFDEGGNLTHFDLVSDNKSTYKGFNLPIHLVKNIFKVIGRLTDDGINTK